MANANPNKQPTVRARIRFAKYGVMRFVGHLDMMRFFQKAIRRAGLPIAYSGGFHPHQIMSFALPLGIGVTSEGEYMDIELTEKVVPENAIQRLNGQMADGVKVLSFVYLPDKSKKAMAAVEAASYVVGLKEPEGKAVHVLARQGADGSAGMGNDGSIFAEMPLEPLFREGLRVFYEEADDIIITKKTKKSERQLDLKPLIYEFKLSDNAETTAFLPSEDVSASNGARHDPYFYLTLSAGSTDNIKPELVFSHFMKSLEIEEDTYRLAIHRLDLLTRNPEGQFVSLGDAAGLL